MDSKDRPTKLSDMILVEDSSPSKKERYLAARLKELVEEFEQEKEEKKSGALSLCTGGKDTTP